MSWFVLFIVVSTTHCLDTSFLTDELSSSVLFYPAAGITIHLASGIGMFAPVKIFAYGGLLFQYITETYVANRLEKGGYVASVMCNGTCNRKDVEHTTGHVRAAFIAGYILLAVYAAYDTLKAHFPVNNNSQQQQQQKADNSIPPTANNNKEEGKVTLREMVKEEVKAALKENEIEREEEEEEEEEPPKRKRRK